jgi:hypothetical protein
MGNPEKPPERVKNWAFSECLSPPKRVRNKPSKMDKGINLTAHRGVIQLEKRQDPLIRGHVLIL